MRFVVRKGTDPVARADTTLLKALGLPFGGVLKVGPTHFLVQGGDTPESTALELGPLALANARLSEGQSVEAVRAVLGPAEAVVVDAKASTSTPRSWSAACRVARCPTATGSRWPPPISPAPNPSSSTSNRWNPPAPA